MTAFVEAEDAFFLTEFRSNEPRHYPLAELGEINQPNVRLCIRLDSEVEKLFAASEAELIAECARPDGVFKKIRVNAAPTLTPIYDALDTMFSEIDADQMESRGRLVSESDDFRRRVTALYASVQKPWPISPHFEGQLHNRFPSPADENRMFQFHDASWSERQAIVESFEDERLQAYGRRLIYFANRGVLSDEARTEVELELTDRLALDSAGGLTLSTAIRELDGLATQNPDCGPALANYRAYLVERDQKVRSYRSTVLGVT